MANHDVVNIASFEKSRQCSSGVISAKAGTYFPYAFVNALNSFFPRGDDFLRNRQD